MHDSGKKAYITGELEFMLEEDFWSATALSNPGIYLYTMRDCPPSYEPPISRVGDDIIDAIPQLVKVANVKGKVTVFTDGESSKVESELEIGSMILDQQVVYTRPGGRAELVTSDKRLFILGEATVVKFNVRKKEDGTLERDLDERAGKY